MASPIMLWYFMLSMLCHFMIRVKLICSFYLMLMLYYGTPHYVMHVSVSPNVCHGVSASFTFSLGPSSVGVGLMPVGCDCSHLHIGYWLKNCSYTTFLAPDFRVMGPGVCIQDKLSMESER